MRGFLGKLVYMGLGISALGCAEASYCPAPSDQVVEMFTWWALPGETNAWNALTGMHESRVKQAGGPQTRVIASRMASNRLARDLLARRRDDRNLPDTFQVNIGQELLSWKGELEPLDFLLDEQPDSRAEFFDAVLAEASSGGRLYGIPLNIHRMNTLFYNRKNVTELLGDGANLDTLEGFEKMCAALKSKYPERAPIALGTKGGTWSLGLLVHQALFPAMWGVAPYRELWQGTTMQQDDHYYYFDLLWKTYDRVIQWKNKGWINTDFARVKWTDAATRLLLTDDDPNQSTFFIMGDWLQAELRDSSKLARAPFPTANGKSENNAPAFVWTADTFPLPKHSANRENAVELLRTLMRTDVQLDFSRHKGAIPARALGTAWEKTETQSATLWDFLHARDHKQAVVSVSGCLQEGQLPSLDDQLESMLMNGNCDSIKSLWSRSPLASDGRVCFQSDK